MKYLRFPALTLCLLAAFLMPGKAEPSADFEQALLHAMRYAATTRASFAPNCRNNTSLAQIPKYKAFCAKRTQIPDTVIELAIMPYIRKHVSQEVALQAITFWSSNIGQALSKKAITEIETGHFDQLSPADLDALDQANKTSYGQALKALVTDKDVSTAVLRAMLAYER